MDAEGLTGQWRGWDAEVSKENHQHPGGGLDVGRESLPVISLNTWPLLVSR